MAHNGYYVTQTLWLKPSFNKPLCSRRSMRRNDLAKGPPSMDPPHRVNEIVGTVSLKYCCATIYGVGRPAWPPALIVLGVP